MITRIETQNAESWKCICFHCSNQLNRGIDENPKPKEMIEKNGWHWFRTSLGSLDCACPKCRGQLIIEATRMARFGLLEEASFEIFNQEK